MEFNADKLDKIHIQDLFLRCIIGTNPEERVKKQDVVIDITMFADLSKAVAGDDISDTVNYHVVKESIVSMVEKSKFFLLERLAGEIAAICLGNELVRGVKVVVHKPGALRYAKNVAVEIFRVKGSG